VASQSEQENLAALTTSAGLLATGNVLGALLVPVSLQLDRIFGGGPRTGTLAEIDPERAPLEIPFLNAIKATGLDVALGQLWLDRLDSRSRKDQVALRRAITNITGNMLFHASLDLLRLVISAAEGGHVISPVPRDVVDQPDPFLPPLPTEEPMAFGRRRVEAKFMPGLNRELDAEVDPPELNTGIQPVIDLSRWLQPEELIGTGVQFFDAAIGGPSLTTPIRIPAKKGKIIGIYNTNVLVNDDATVTDRIYRLIAGTVIAGGTGDTSGTYVRQHGQMRNSVAAGATQNPIFTESESFGSYVVLGGQDYVVGVNVVGAFNINFGISVMGYYFDEGMWPIGGK